MEMGADLFLTVVNWVVTFEPLVRRIGCNDKEMWDAYLLARDGSNFFCISKRSKSKNDATLCHASVEQPLFEIKVFGLAKMEDETQSVMPHANALKHMPIKMSSGMS